MSEAQSYYNILALTHFLRFTDFANFCRVLGLFLINYNGKSYETLVMHTSGWVKLKVTVNIEPRPTLYGSLSSQIFVEFLRLDQFLRHYKG